MCGIVGATARRPVSEILLEGLRRLEYRGYDSAGLAVLGQGDPPVLQRRRTLGKVAELVAHVHDQPVQGSTGIAHTRWATHGAPSALNAHPHQSQDLVSVVHNGIIENYEPLRQQLADAGYQFESETDSEVIAHLIHASLSETDNLTQAVRLAVRQLEGAFAIAVVCVHEPDTLVAARVGSPLAIGVGIGENFIASDVLALRPVTDRFIFLEEGDLVELTPSEISIWNLDDEAVVRATVEVKQDHEEADRGPYRHHMLKEIHEQPNVIRRTLEGRIGRRRLLEKAFGLRTGPILDQVRAVTIVACGSSYYTGAVARYWIEALAGLPCQVEIASEYRYRDVAVPADSLFVTISQSGETADTLAALRQAKQAGYLATLTLCNVATSSMVRESDLYMLLEAGPEIGVASTKAFTVQLVDLLLLALLLARRQGLAPETEETLITALRDLPTQVGEVLDLDPIIARHAERFIDREHALFLGRGSLYPIAMEGALKLKEISYIHAEGYAAGELKHGPLALVDEQMPVVAVAPNDDLLDKLYSNLEVVRARGGKLLVFADAQASLQSAANIDIVRMPAIHELLAPILYTVPLQLLAYHAAVLKGTDVDQPRNLAKSVTVE